ncbi:MAG TPA: tetratricopeptide repeat protein [Chitinophagaceae bacterium]
MSDKKIVTGEGGEVVIAKAKDFWARNSKAIMIVCGAVILLAGGWLIYKNYFREPQNLKASEALYKAEEYYRMDSCNLALNGDGQHMGFLRVISRYKGTDAANLAHFYAGSCYLKMGDNQNAIKHLKEFETSAKQIQARAYRLLADAYADAGNNNDALNYYKKAARHFEKDQSQSAEALFMAAYFADRVIKNQKEAIELYKEVKEKYPNTQQGMQVDNYLAQLGVYNVN